MTTKHKYLRFRVALIWNERILFTNSCQTASVAAGRGPPSPTLPLYTLKEVSRVQSYHGMAQVAQLCQGKHCRNSHHFWRSNVKGINLFSCLKCGEILVTLGGSAGSWVFPGVHGIGNSAWVYFWEQNVPSFSVNSRSVTSLYSLKQAQHSFSLSLSLSPF